MAMLHSSVASAWREFETLGDFRSRPANGPVRAVLCALVSADPERVDSRAPACDRDYWTDWVAKKNIVGPWIEAVVRSLITLKALTYAPTGGMVAAATTSLPECIGGVRNWDYRYCWLRDTTLTLLALMNAGYYEEAHIGAIGCCGRSPAARAGADHVWPARRAAVERMGRALVAGLRGLAGAHRQCRADAGATRYLWRDDRRIFPGAPGRHRSQRLSAGCSSNSQAS